MILVIVAITFLGLADARMTVALVEGGHAYELNPLLAPFVLEPWFVPVKVLGTFIALVAVYEVGKRTTKRYWYDLGILVALLIYAGLMAWHASVFTEVLS